MKCSATQEKPGFQPITLTLTVESERDLKTLYALVNTGGAGLARVIDREGIEGRDIERVQMPIWVELHETLGHSERSLGLKVKSE